MSTPREETMVALSGGVDSSVAAALLLEAGYDCSGVFMITGEQSCHARQSAEEVARRLDIELHILDLRTDFERILAYFCREYKAGRTPNPCVVCNRTVKFGRLWDFARNAGARYMATGHYARLITRNGRTGLYEGADSRKDQSYVLSMVRREVLDHVRLPMGEYSKDQARQIAVRLGLGTEARQESQEICFIPDGDHIAVLEGRHPELVQEGLIVDSTGQPLGTHQGVHRFTIGQRRGLRVAMGRPWYVTGLDPVHNRVVLGPREQVTHRRLRAGEVNWLIDEPRSPFRAIVKIRYNDRGKPATVRPQGARSIVEFDEPNAAITPGQLAVFYVAEDDMRRVAGAGWIDEVTD